jgi:aspartyl-tRNA(Asn)/glutamyl-tRNA(Gln) amidotransferase subunit C
MSDAISPAEVEHIAGLARLALSTAETEQYARELSAVLDHVAALQNLDTSEVRPTAHALELTNVLRDDVEGPCLDRAEVLAAAPDVADDRFRVPRILGEAP